MDARLLATRVIIPATLFAGVIGVRGQGRW